MDSEHNDFGAITPLENSQISIGTTSGGEQDVITNVDEKNEVKEDGAGENAVVPDSEQSPLPSGGRPRVYPTVGAFAVQGNPLSPSIDKEIDTGSYSVNNPPSTMNREHNDFGAITPLGSLENSPQISVGPTSGGEQDNITNVDEKNEVKEDGAGEIVAVPVSEQSPLPSGGPKVYPTVEAYAVQCANCFKWRLITNQEKYEEIREHIIEVPFVCEIAREWKSEISCDDPPDITQDGSRLWAIDKPNIAVTPCGWKRLLRFRGQGGTRFADVYYVAPSGKKFRSMVEIEKYLEEHPGLSKSQFSFHTPKPLPTNYVTKKRPAMSAPQMDDSLEPLEANPISWIAPNMEQSEPGISDNPNA